MQRTAGNVFMLVAMVLVAAIFAARALASPGAGLLIELETDDYAPDRMLEGRVILRHDVFISKSATLNVYVDDKFVSAAQLGGILNDRPYYQFVKHQFEYNVTASGANEWVDYPVQSFDYSFDVRGTCGNPRDAAQGGCCNWAQHTCSCQCPAGCAADPNDNESYPCAWSFTHGSVLDTGTVRANNGLKFIYDGSTSITIPADANPDTLWSEISNSNGNVTTTMRAACGGEMYAGQMVFPSGWVYQDLDPGTWPGIGTHKYTNITPFDHNSLLGVGRRLFADQVIGGIYKNGIYQQYGTQAEWNGSTGYIKIFDYNSNAQYTINYLPPNGPHLCAYTSVKTEESEAWTSTSITFDPETNESGTYVRIHDTAGELPPIPGCPPGCAGAECFPQEQCNSTLSSYQAVEISDPGNAVGISFDAASGKLTATATSPQLQKYYSEEIPFSAFGVLDSTPSTGGHVLKIELREGINVLASNVSYFRACNDRDGDGYCSISEQGNDCDEDISNDPYVCKQGSIDCRTPVFSKCAMCINPGSREFCDGIDNNCNGRIDEGLTLDGKEMGSHCGGREDSACGGTWRCSADGTQAVCMQEHQPGELFEICDNVIDDDCDMEIDEYMTIDKEPACWCSLGKTEGCGSSVGECTKGIRSCVMTASGFPEWSICKGGTLPQTEKCNQKDDDCDGIIDNVNRGTSMASAECGCYEGRLPVTESCNDIDDNCNGEVDEGISCCDESETRECGSAEGACEKGIQTCRSGTWQESECTGEVRPKAEICYNGQDDDCDGGIDEGCNPDYTCRNGLQDLNEDGVDCGGSCQKWCPAGGLWMIFAGAAILVLLSIWVMVMKGRI